MTSGPVSRYMRWLLIGSKDLTSPVEEAKQFVEFTGIDVLAPAVGNMHGLSQNMVQGQMALSR